METSSMLLTPTGPSSCSSSWLTSSRSCTSSACACCATAGLGASMRAASIIGNRCTISSTVCIGAMPFLLVPFRADPAPPRGDNIVLELECLGVLMRSSSSASLAVETITHLLPARLMLALGVKLLLCVCRGDSIVLIGVVESTPVQTVVLQTSYLQKSIDFIKLIIYCHQCQCCTR